MEFLSLATNQVFFPGLRQLTPSIPHPFHYPFPSISTSNNINNNNIKHKVVFVMGPTGTGKSKLAIDLAAHFDGEVVNSDKIQVYSGLHIITNKVTDAECAGIPHHLIGGVHPDADFPASAFRESATKCVESIVVRGRLPIVAGGSNSYIEELVEGNNGSFRAKYDCCFVWVDVELRVLEGFVSGRVDKMVEMGLVEEARGVFELEGDYSKGIRRAIGLAEMDGYFRAELEGKVDEEGKRRVLDVAVAEMKENTCKLTRRQLEKIRRLARMWDVKRVDATEAFLKEGGSGDEQVWNRVAKGPSVEIVEDFLRQGEINKTKGSELFYSFNPKSKQIIYDQI